MRFACKQFNLFFSSLLFSAKVLFVSPVPFMVASRRIGFTHSLIHQFRINFSSGVVSLKLGARRAALTNANFCIETPGNSFQFPTRRSEETKDQGA